VTSLIDRQHCRNNGSHFRELQSRSLRLFDSTHPYSFRTIRVASGYGVAHRGRHLKAIYSGRCKLRFEEVQSYRPDASDRSSDLVPFGRRIESAPVHKQNSRRLFSDLRISSTSPAQMRTFWTFFLLRWCRSVPRGLIGNTFPAKSDVEGDKMTSIPATVLTVDKQSSQYRVLVQIELENYLGSFQAFRFGKKRPFTGTCYHGRLDLFYYRDPDLKVGKPFPLWVDNVT
jgi:hypothetical protein